MNGNEFHQDEAAQLFQKAYEKQMKGDLGEAIETYEKSIELFPTAEAHTFLGWALSMKGCFQSAIDECHKAIKLDPDYGNPYNDIGAYLIESGKHDEAIEWLEKATQAKRYDSYCYPLYNMGRVWEKKGQWDKALSYYQDAIRENRDYKLAKKAINRVLSLLN